MYQYFTPRKVLFPPLNMGHDTLILFERNTAEAVLSSYVEWGGNRALLSSIGMYFWAMRWGYIRGRN